MNRVARALLVLIGIFPLVGPSPTRADSPARAKDAPAIRSHTVAAGETLWSIASRYDTTVEALSELNGIADVSRVPAGLELTLQRQPIEAEPTPDDRMASLSSAGPVASPEWEVTAVTPAADPPPGTAAPASPPRPSSAGPVASPEWEVTAVTPAVDPPPGTVAFPSTQRPSSAGSLAPPEWNESPTIRPIDPPPGIVQLASTPRSRALVLSADRSKIKLAAARGEKGVLRRLEIQQGETVLFDTEYAVKRVSIGNSEILDVVVMSPHELQLVAKSAGSTNVLLWGPQGRRLEASIDVQVSTPYEHIERELQRILEIEEIEVIGTRDGLILRGRVPNAIAMEQALSITASYLGELGLDRVVNLLEVGGNHQVMIKVIIAEMSRSVRHEFGTNFNTLIESGGKTVEIFSFLGGLTRPGTEPGFIELSNMANLAGTFFGFGAVDFRVVMDLLSEKGLSKILAEPTLIARSGESASFLVGGEVPIPVNQSGLSDAITIEFKKFGVGITFTPTVLAADRIHLRVSAEVSAPDFAFGTEVGGTIIPSFNTRRAATAVEVGDGQSFAIAGLLHDEIFAMSAQYPILGQIPLLGALFRSTQWQKKQSEVVMIVTPHLVKPLGPGPHALPTDSFIEPDAWEIYLLGRLEGRPEPFANPANSNEVAAYAEGSGGLIGHVGHRVSVSP